MCREMIAVEHTIARVKEVGPLTGMDFFTVEWSTVTSMLSTTLTYLIILIQTANPPTPSLK